MGGNPGLGNSWDRAGCGNAAVHQGGDGEVVHDEGPLAAMHDRHYRNTTKKKFPIITL